MERNTLNEFKFRTVKLKMCLLERAIQNASKSSMAHKIGCVISDGRGHIFDGHNIASNSCSIHAEAIALQRLFHYHGLIKSHRQFRWMIQGKDGCWIT